MCIRDSRSGPQEMLLRTAHFNDVSQCLAEIVCYLNFKNYMHSMGRGFGDEDQGSDFRTKYEITSAIPAMLFVPSLLTELPGAGTSKVVSS